MYFRNKTPKAMEPSANLLMEESSIVCDFILAFLSWLSEVSVTTN